METHVNVKKGTKISLVVIMLLMLFSLVATAGGLVNATQSGRLIGNLQIAANMAAMILVFVYALWGYKKPHGNSLRLTCLLFGVLLMARLILPGAVIENTVSKYIVNAATGLSSVLVAYMSGRLHKWEKNKYIMIFVGILLAVAAVIVVTSFPEFVFMRFVSNVSQLICWVALCLAYTVRFEDHKAAGLENK